MFKNYRKKLSAIFCNLLGFFMNHTWMHNKCQHLCCFALVDNWQNHLIIKGSILVYSVFYLRVKHHFVSILNLLAVNGNHESMPHENPAIAKNFRHKVPLLVTFGRSPLWAYSIELNQVNGLFMRCHSGVPWRCSLCFSLPFPLPSIQRIQQTEFHRP